MCSPPPILPTDRSSVGTRIIATPFHQPPWQVLCRPRIGITRPRECRWQTTPALLLARVFQLPEHGGLGKSRPSAARMLMEPTTADSSAATPTHRQEWDLKSFQLRAFLILPTT